MASKNIRGITIEIGGDTTKLGKALENSEKKSRALKLELNSIERALKFDPTNIELLSQKQTVLTQNIEETSKKLDTLKEAEKQVIEQFKRGEIAEDQVRDLQREILKTEGVLGSMKTELSNTNKTMKDLEKGTYKNKEEIKEYAEKVEEAEENLQEFGDSASESFDKLKTGALALGAGVTAVAGYATNLSIEFDKAYNLMQSQTGATAEEMQGLEESINNIYKSNFGENMEDVARSMASVKTQTNLTGKELENVTKNAILIRDTFGFEVDESIRGVNSLMDQFGISADEAYNLIVQGAQKGLNQNGDLMDVINEYGVQFQTAGYSAEDMFNMLANGVESGTWSVDKLGDAVKEFNIRMSDGTAKDAVEALGFSWESVREGWSKGGDEAKETFNMLVNELDGLENTTEGYNIGVGLLGTMFEDLGFEAVLALSQTEGEISKTSDALKNLNDIRYDDIGSALQGLGRTLQTDLVDPIGEELKPVIEDAIDYVQKNSPKIQATITKIIDAVGKFVSLVVDNGNTIVGIITAIGVGFLTWKVATIIGGIVTAISSMITMLKAGKLAWSALNIVMKANIIGIVIGAITALVSAFLYFWNTSEGFRNFWIGLWETVRDAVLSAVEWISGALSTAFDFIKNNWQGLLLFLVNPLAGAFKLMYDNFEGFRNFVDNIVSIVVGYFDNAWKSIVKVWSGVVSWFNDVWLGIVNVFSPAIKWFSDLFNSIYKTLKSMIDVVIALIRGTWTTITTIFGVASNWFNTKVIQPIKNAFNTMWNNVKTFASNAWTGIVNTFSSLANWFNGSVISPVKNYFSGMWSNVVSGASQAWQGVKNAFSNVASWFGSIFSDAWTRVKNVFSTGGAIFTGITEGITSAFKKVVNAIIGGINRVVSTPFNAINRALNTLRGATIAGIKPFSSLPSISVPSIPYLYRGGILKKGQVGLLEGNGAEAVVPLEKETGWINRIAQKMNELQNGNTNGSMSALESKMDEMIRTMKGINSTIVLDSGELIGATINKIDEKLGKNYTLSERRI